MNKFTPDDKEEISLHEFLFQDQTMTSQIIPITQCPKASMCIDDEQREMKSWRQHCRLSICCY